MLIGEHIHIIDEKNRLSLPAKFRKELGKIVVLAPGFDKSIFMFQLAEWKKISEKLSESSMFQSDTRSINRFMFGGAVEAEIDASGRILIPEFLKNRAGLRGRAVIIGVQSRVEIWNEKDWNSYKKNVDDHANELAERLGGIGIL